MQAQIRSDVEKNMTEQQRKFFLQEQLKVIQKELGISKDDRTADVEEFEERVERLALSEEAESKVSDELQKLAVLETGSPEYGVTRNYLDWVTSLPWGQFSEDNLDLERARTILDAEHAGLDDIEAAPLPPDHQLPFGPVAGLERGQGVAVELAHSLTDLLHVGRRPLRPLGAGERQVERGNRGGFEAAVLVGHADHVVVVGVVEVELHQRPLRLVDR